MQLNVPADIASVLTEHWPLLAGILLILLLGQGLAASALKIIFGQGLPSGEIFSLSAAGALLPVWLASVLWLGAGILLRPAWTALPALLALGLTALYFARRAGKAPWPGSRPILFLLAALFGISVFLRLALLSEAIVPLYFDSAQHYLIIKNLLRGPEAGAGVAPGWPIAGYYHIGYHLLTAFIASGLGADLIDAMLVLGQIVLAIIPLPLFALVQHETRSPGAGLLAMLLAAFGWYMPAYAVNWGKYPALTSLPLITLVLALAYLSVRFRGVLSAGKHLALNGMLLLGVLVTGFVHSRSLVIFALAALAWVAAAGWHKLPGLPRLVVAGAILLAIGLEIRFIGTEAVFNPLFDPYWNRGLAVTLFVFLLSIFAYRMYPRLTFVCMVVVSLLLISLFVPVHVPGYGTLTLLDRPFVEMILYLPLSILGGLGLAGLAGSLRRLTGKWQAVGSLSARYSGALVIGLLLSNALAGYTLYPADCCSIVGKDDLIAIDWIDRLPPDASIVISSTELRVLPAERFQGAVGGDAGAWIAPLTDRVTIPLPFSSDFTQPATFDTLCQLGGDYIYVGEIGAAFNADQLTAHPERYRPVLSMLKAKVFEVVDCP